LDFTSATPSPGSSSSLFILHVGYEVTKDVFFHLMDGIEPEHLKEARQVATATASVGVPIARGRWLGRSLAVELEPLFPPETTLADVNAVSDRIEEAVLAAIDEATTVTVRPRI